ATQARFHSSARSASWAKASATNATSAAPPSNNIRGMLLRDSRRVWRALRRATISKREDTECDIDMGHGEQECCVRRGAARRYLTIGPTGLAVSRRLRRQ